MNAIQKLVQITRELTNGNAIYVTTMTRSMVVTPKQFFRCKAKGVDVFKVKGASLYLMTGKRYDCIDFCRITVVAKDYEVAL